jgi:hypothetical protein
VLYLSALAASSSFADPQRIFTYTPPVVSLVFLGITDISCTSRRGLWITRACLDQEKWGLGYFFNSPS